MNAPYALFDPHSGYNVLLSTLVPHHKIRGYFSWRQFQVERGAEQSGPSPERPPLVFRGGAPAVPLKARVTIPAPGPLPDRYTVEVELLEPMAEGTPCRAFIVEQGVLNRLRALPEVLPDGTLRPVLADDDVAALTQLFDHRLLSENFSVWQAVAALPDLAGRLQGNRAVFEEKIPPGSPNISDKAWVVVVFDGPVSLTPAAPAPATENRCPPALATAGPAAC